MRRKVISGIAVLLSIPAGGQVSTPQTLKERAMGDALARDIERNAGKIDDAALIGYLQRVENHIALSAGAKPVEVRVTRSTLQSASPLPNGVLYISGGMLERMESEAELAGLLGHEMAHALWYRPTAAPVQGIPLVMNPCVLASPVALASGSERRDPEFQATETAVKTLKAAGYEPEAILDLFSKLSYEHPVWAKAIVPDDLLNLRATLDTDIPPTGGYTVDSSDFRQQHARLLTILRPDTSRKPPPSLSLH